MLNIVIFGAPGSGKGTQSENIIKKYNLDHISTGDVLRSEKASGSELGKLADSYMSKGQLIPDELMVGILAKVFDEKTSNKECKGIIFDGFPRTVPQSKALSEMLAERNQKIAAVISLDVPEDELITRLLNRAKILGRSDDTHDVIKARLDVFNNQTSPLKALYKEEGIFHSINGLGDVNKIFEDISVSIEKVK